MRYKIRTSAVPRLVEQMEVHCEKQLASIGKTNGLKIQCFL